MPCPRPRARRRGPLRLDRRADSRFAELIDALTCHPSLSLPRRADRTKGRRPLGPAVPPGQSRGCEGAGPASKCVAGAGSPRNCATRAEMQSMIRSAAWCNTTGSSTPPLRSARSTGGPASSWTLCRWIRSGTFGLRGMISSVPHCPTGITGHPAIPRRPRGRPSLATIGQRAGIGPGPVGSSGSTHHLSRKRHERAQRLRQPSARCVRNRSATPPRTRPVPSGCSPRRTP